MKKSFRLTKGKHAPARVIDGIKAKLNKHIKQERYKELPDETDFWDFVCKVGVDEASATEVHVTAIGKAVDAAAAASTIESIYVEITTVGKRRNPPKAKPKVEGTPESSETSSAKTTTEVTSDSTATPEAETKPEANATSEPKVVVETPKVGEVTSPEAK